MATLAAAAPVTTSPGDIVPTAPATDTSLVLREILISADGFVEFRFVDGFGRVHNAIVRNGQSQGFNYSTNAPVAVATPTGFTDMLTTLTLSAAKRTAAVQSLLTAGVVVVTGTVG